MLRKHLNDSDDAKYQPTHAGPFLLQVKCLIKNINSAAVSGYSLNAVSEASPTLHQTKCCRQVKIKHPVCVCPVSMLASSSGKLQITTGLHLSLSAQFMRYTYLLNLLQPRDQFVYRIYTWTVNYCILLGNGSYN